MKGKLTLILILVMSIVLACTAGVVAGSLMDWNFAGYFANGGEDMLATRPNLENNNDSTQPVEPEYTLPTEPEYTEPEWEAITLKVWATSEDLSDESGWLYTMLERFEAEHPEYVITWELGVFSEGDAVSMITADVESAADVFMFASDQIGTLINTQALAQIGGEYLEQIQQNHSQSFVDTLTYTDGGVYGFPMSANTWFMYYNKSIYSEEDIKSLDTMLEKAPVAFPITNPWYIWSFYAAGGGSLFGDHGVDASAGVSLGSNGAAITKYLVNLVNHPNFVSDQNGDGYTGLSEGRIGAMFSGSWDAVGIYEALGENMGVAPLPSIHVDGTEMQLKSFANSRAIGVNRQSENMNAALQLAAFLSSPESQLLRYEQWGILPAATKLIYEYPVSENPVAVGQALTMEYTSTVQPCIPEMINFWTPAGNMGTALCNGEITLDNYEEQTYLFEQYLNNSGL